MIDYGTRFAYENAEKFERIISNHQNSTVLNSSNIQRNNYGLESTELKILFSLLAHKDQIIKEIDAYNILFRTIKLAKNNYKDIDRDSERSSLKKSQQKYRRNNRHCQSQLYGYSGNN